MYTINHNSKNKNRKIYFALWFSTVGIFHVNIATSDREGGLHILTWDRVKLKKNKAFHNIVEHFSMGGWGKGGGG